MVKSSTNSGLPCAMALASLATKLGAPLPNKF
eukprot:SAG31_NODE_42518_length_271_cov_0.616279_1_plen_31_part_01